jgi:2-octaprenyl-6-methoxyphenol hydroxylase
LNIVVIGAGPVGATFALLAKRAGLSVSLLEAREGVSRETRTLALSHGSREIFEMAGAWHKAIPATPIHSIHNSHKGGFGRTIISREDGGVPALGYVLTYADIQTALDEAMAAQQIETQRGAVVGAIDAAMGGADVSAVAEITYTQAGAERIMRADVVVMADGGANLSKVPALTLNEKDYGQAALLARVSTDSPHGNRAYERFTPEGPAALLPKDQAKGSARGDGGSYSLVWVSTPQRIEELKALDDVAFCAAFQDHFGSRAGKFLSVTDRRSYPLRLRTVDAPVAGRVVVIGNAAQALHPVAGQGFNLGLRDAHELSDMLAQHPADALTRYARARASDVSRSVGFTDFLVSAFSNDHALMRLPRGLGLAAVDLLPGARRALAKRMLFGSAR